ncbi:NrdH-redoxin [Candidatus Nomurabacteria bacterium RIFCSPHIGHO2_02_FULL_33_12]|uniref:NrdH-redoxin n=1 Tax=Candidatus Nomurabacteria bacterium RIFCSPLOWO2_01_FULL_33_17 TaxID=1801764 RepID=A0A1F6WN08_9BACT|nr:MAG: NrdH-redoxin [Candidatus Nomurabacteria bacterium RIFCSPHIGHO2_02_FULL_33_12]OGI83214.1 MAG: NrdH-redoxin [Candidatus Nomurabacteria bacterium RIFCSPLOWO2_01_FULL_33_17]
MKKITIYSTPSCHFCHMAKEYLTEKGIEFTDIDVAENQEARTEMIKISGQMGVPVIQVENDVIIGFNKPVLNDLLGITD